VKYSGYEHTQNWTFKMKRGQGHLQIHWNLNSYGGFPQQYMEVSG